MKSLAAPRGRLGLLTGQIALAIVVGLVLAPGAATGWMISGPWGIAAAVVAAVSCWMGAASALAAAALLSGVANGLGGLLAGMGLRMGIPLTCGLLLQLTGGPLTEAGVLYYLLVFYPITLSVEIALSIRHASADKRAASLPEQGPS